MKSASSKQNEVWSGINSGVNLKDKIPEIVLEISKVSSFVPNQLVSTSSWWNQSTGIGAFHFSGKFDGKDVVLKVQGVKPNTSEILMIDSFAKQNKSNIIRPPHIYARFPWDEAKGYEAFILEDVGNNLLITVPTDINEVNHFFDYYKEYRKNCIVKPWIEIPETDLATTIKHRFDEWIKTSHKVFPDHPFRLQEDEELILKGVNLLINCKEWLIPEFVHGHFSARDLFKVDNQIVVLSNLYWSWRTQYFDLIFAYHWFMYDLVSVNNLSQDEIEKQRQLWLEQIEAIASNKKVLKYALLERSLAGLNLDALSIDIKKPNAKYLVDRTREIVKELIEELS